jgi:hypothetical protein
MTNPIYILTHLSFVAVKAGAPMSIGASTATGADSCALVSRCAP